MGWCVMDWFSNRPEWAAELRLTDQIDVDRLVRLYLDAAHPGTAHSTVAAVCQIVHREFLFSQLEADAELALGIVKRDLS